MEWPCPVAEFIDPDWGDKVNSGLGLSLVVPARQATWAGGPVRQPYVGVDFIPRQVSLNSATENRNVASLLILASLFKLVFTYYTIL